MATNVEIPAMGESITEAVLARWIKADGDQVQTDEPICELETDKANFDLPAPASGLLHTMKKEGDSVRVGDTIARIDEAVDTAPTKAKTAQPTTASPPDPHAPTRTRGQKADAQTAEKTRGKPETATPEPPPNEQSAEDHGPKGEAINDLPTETCVGEARLPGQAQEFTTQKATSETTPTAENRPRAKAPEKSPADSDEAATPAVEPFTSDADGTRRVAMSKIRRRIAERLVAAQHQAAMLTTFNEIDMTAVLDLRNRYKARFEEKHGTPLGLMSFFARACVLALREFPVLNAQIDGTDIVYHEHVNLGLAVSTERGLVVPVLHNVEAMSFGTIESEIKRIAGAARDGKLKLPELSGGTFTITNGGAFGSLFSTPILNPPQSGILGMHAIQKRPSVVNDRIDIRPMMYVALTYDHRLVDGSDSVRFLVRVKELIEDPSRMVLGI